MDRYDLADAAAELRDYADELVRELKARPADVPFIDDQIKDAVAARDLLDTLAISLMHDEELTA